MKKATVYVTLPENCPFHLHHHSQISRFSYDICMRKMDLETGEFMTCKCVIPKWCPLETSYDYEDAGMI